MTQVQFDIYERGRSAAGALADKLMAGFDDHKFDLRTNEIGLMSLRYFNDYCLKQSETVYRWVVIFEMRYWIMERVNS